ncbi:MAG: long-chain-fatty-acid--CoA ligase FadD2 [Solirubrobacterales bacterium]|nr:long-chain-fatty-acid--CoA ligase FadD2 [Solirubrobacterales bacterium]
MAVATGTRRAALALGKRLVDEGFYAAVCLRAGMLAPPPPQQLVPIGLALERYGMLGGLPAVAAIRHGDHPAVIDERGQLTWRELDDRINTLASAWYAQGLRAGDGIAVLARNHRGLLEAVWAGFKLGAKVILMNTGFSGPQVREVSEREGVDLLVYDEEYAGTLGDFAPRLGRVRAWTESDHQGEDSLEALIAAGVPTPPPKPKTGPRLVILTSGTTGTPKGAGRQVPMSLSPVGGPLSKVPYRVCEPTNICAPIFHALGFSQTVIAMSLCSSMVLARRFDPKETLEAWARHGVTTAVMVPVMLSRIIELPDEVWEHKDLSKLRIVFLSGSQLGSGLAQRASKRLGSVLYNLYGSTEVAYATIATPEDLAAAPNTVGRVVHGATVKILDEDGHEQPRGETGRVFVANTIQFEGYTGGGSKQMIDGLMSSGDVGHFDAAGRLFIDGRDDDMIVSGGENVFPAEVEELLSAHPKVVEAAAIGVDDPEFGQRLKAFVVPAPGESVDETKLREYVKTNLANYKVPREIVFMDELPRNQTGKVLKRELRSQ